MVTINTKFKLIALFLVLFLLPVVPAFADEQVVIKDQNQIKIVVFKLNDKNYYLQDSNGNVTATRMDVTPYVESGRTFVPVRFLGNALGLPDDNIKWDNAARTATLKGKKTLVLTLGSKIMKSDGSSITMDVAPGVKPPGRTMLPARYVAEGLGFQVDWDPEKQLVVCYPQGEPRPDLSKILEKLTPANTPKPFVAQGNTTAVYPNAWLKKIYDEVNSVFMRATINDLPIEVYNGPDYRLIIHSMKVKPPTKDFVWAQLLIEQTNTAVTEVPVRLFKNGEQVADSGVPIHENPNETHWTQPYAFNPDKLNEADEIWIDTLDRVLIIPNFAKGTLK